MRANIIDGQYAVIWGADRVCGLFLANAAAIDHMRVRQLEAVGLPPALMVHLWHCSRI